jgi:hypothetical protein
MMRILSFVLAACTILPASASPVFSVSPAPPDLFGMPGDTVGWGFTITNDTNFLEITSAQFCLNPVSFPACTPADIGTFTDFISQFNDIVLGPGNSATQDFDPILFKGVGSFAIDPGAPLQTTDFGQLVLTYDVYTADPNEPDSGAILLFSDLTLSQNASVTAGVPEPGTFTLALGMLLSCCLRAFFRR